MKVSNDIVHAINVATHIPAFVYIGVYGAWNNVTIFSLLCSLVASCLMHVSETKHNLNGMFGTGTYSGILLDIDRVFAIILGFLVFVNVETWKSPFYAATFCIAFVALSVGERTNNNLIYLVCHSIWHLLVFYMAGHIACLVQPSIWPTPVWSNINALKSLVISMLIIGSIIVSLAVITIVLHPPFTTSIFERIYSNVLWKIKTSSANKDLVDDKILYLTIDDGVTENTQSIMDVLARFNSTASFFVAAENVITASSKLNWGATNDIMSFIAQSGNPIENHMYEQEFAASKMSLLEFSNSVTHSQRVIDAATSSYRVNMMNMNGTSPVISKRRYLRPASGFINENKLRWAREHRYSVTLGSVHPFDAKPYWFWNRFWKLACFHLKIWFTIFDLTTNIKSFGGHPVVVLHDRPWTPLVLSEILPWWISRGWTVKCLPPLDTVQQ